SWINVFLVGTASIGAFLGYLLFGKELGITFRPVEYFCNTSTRVNCDKILSSDGGRIFSFFSLSQAVVSYFLLQVLIVGLLTPLMGDPSSYLLVLAAFSVFSLPVIIYSIHYQYVVMKTWCMLCMLVNAVLITQAIFFGFLATRGDFLIQDIQGTPFIVSLFLGLIVMAGVVLLKQKNQTFNEAINTGVEASRVKNDPEIFSLLLSQGRQIDEGDFEKNILIGNPGASIKLLMVASLHCYPCKQAFFSLLPLIEHYADDISVELRFPISQGSSIHGLLASTYIIQYWQRYVHGGGEESEKTIELIRDWYDRERIADFEKEYPKLESNALLEDFSLEEKHYGWITDHRIARTPTFFLNGYPFPKKYWITDLKNMLPMLRSSINSRSQLGANKELVT
ncbi:MAG: vitamin K epoxide reductase family protein, partial [Bacteroidota bacterium]